MASPSQQSLMRGMIGVAAAALLALAALTTTSHVRSTALLQAKQDKMDHYISGAERQLSVLSRSLPVGSVAAKYPKEESELRQLFAHSEQGLQALAAAEKKEKEAEKKKKNAAPKTSLAQRSAQKKDLHKLVGEAGRMMASLEAQLPPADKKAFPKEAGELNAAFSSELKHLKGIDHELSKDAKKKSRTSTLRGFQTPNKQSMAEAQAALDKDVAKDRKENQAIASSNDVSHMMDALNAPIKPDPRGHLVHKVKAAMGRPQALAENSVMYAPAQKEYNKYENTVSKWMNVHDPAAPTTHGSNWWEDSAKRNDKWWTHNHAGRGY